MSEHVYVYCAVDGSPSALPLEGMPDASPPRERVLCDGISLIVSDVSSAVYNPATLEPKLSDLDWVGAAGAAHHAVVDAVAESGLAVVPCRLFTIFSSEHAALVAFRQQHQAITRVFERVRGRQEWVLRIGTPDPSRAEDVTTAAPERVSGTSFLRAKADARREAAARAQRVKQDAAAAYDALTPLAEAAKTRAVEPGGNLLIDAVFLVTPSQVESLHGALTRRAERLLHDGCPVSLTGPWPPYSFASLDAIDDA